MELFNQMLILESQKAAHKEVKYTIQIINKIYKEWKKLKRRVNAIDIIATSTNKISNINPVMVDYLHPMAIKKLVIIIMRCLDNPLWKPLDQKERIYKKLYPLIEKLQYESVNTGTKGQLKDVIMTRFSANISYNLSKGQIFVAYEPIIPKSYIRFLFGTNIPLKTYKIQGLRLPTEFESLIDILTINQQKAIQKFHPHMG